MLKYNHIIKYNLNLFLSSIKIIIANSTFFYIYNYIKIYKKDKILYLQMFVMCKVLSDYNRSESGKYMEENAKNVPTTTKFRWFFKKKTRVLFKNNANFSIFKLCYSQLNLFNVIFSKRYAFAPPQTWACINYENAIA